MAFQDSCIGSALHPGDGDYEDSVTTVTGVGSPRLVVRPRSTQDVASAIRYAQEQHLAITVRSGGHSLAGLSQARDGMLIDMRQLDSVETNDATRHVLIGGGATWGHVASVLEPAGLALTAGDTADVGVAGLTLGGGIGWMVRKYGLAIDSLVAAEAVTYEGTVLRLSEDENPDLFWAVRGGGGNFAILTHLEFEAHPVSNVVFGTIMYALDRLEDARSLVRAWNESQADADRRLTSVLALMPAMQESPAMAMLQLCFVGTENEAKSSIDAFKAMGAVMNSDIGYRPYASILVTDDPFPAPRAAQQNSLLPAFGEREQSAVCDAFETGQLMMAIRALGGAVRDIDAQATAFAGREAAVMVVGTQLLSGTDSAQRQIAHWQGIQRLEMGAYVNWIGLADDTASKRCYPDRTRARLAAIKSEADPENVFSDAVGFAV
ncbi:MAG: FAD-binding oxidoreductase [Bifidobacterium sp.]|uniref:FAD-binding oxidoreductase n=1 Tax=Bifidobacterium sp. TaxID=41200 RepID=UPI0039E8DB5F